MLARRAITLEEEITEIDAILKPLVKETAPELVSLSASAPTPPRRFSSLPATILNVFATRRPSLTSAAPHRSTPAAARTNDTGSTAAGSSGQLRPLAHRDHPDGL